MFADPRPSADAVYPLLAMAHLTGKDKYLDAAVKLQRWWLHMNRPDGSFHNEPTGNDWRGITVFSAIALANRCGGTARCSMPRREGVGETTPRGLRFRPRIHYSSIGNVNYPVTATATLALAYELFGDEKYKLRARELAGETRAFLTPKDKFIFGEGQPVDKKTPQGLLPVDIGYNVEESLRAMAVYGLAFQDEETLAAVTGSRRSHLEFMFPDGGWDNSFGTRNYKWSYWGSRTSDGCQVAYGLLADRDPAFAKAVEMNTRLLAACTHGGILYGGPHLKQRGYLPCIHHTFCHAKALATLIDCGFAAKYPAAVWRNCRARSPTGCARSPT